MKMPKIDLSACNLTVEEMKLAEGILATQGKNKGCLRAAKPKVNYEKKEVTRAVGYKVYTSIQDMPCEDGSGETAYIWRLVCFNLVAAAPYCCMPVCADFDLPGEFSMKEDSPYRKKIKFLDAIVDKIVNNVPKSQWGGVLRWKAALGG